MATVYVGALRGELGFEQLVALKRPHEHLMEDESFRSALLAEARLASRLRHANVVDVRDVEVHGSSVQLVMDYVEGGSLAQLLGAWQRGGPALPPAVAVRIVLDACAGLHAVHELTGERGEPLGLVHRDVSPQNILVGVDGVARITDFGIAKCVHAAGDPTTQGTLKGKLGYLAPESVRGRAIDRRVDVFALGVCLWEALAGKRLFKGETDGDTVDRVLRQPVPLVSQARPGLGTALDDVVACALARDPGSRFASAREMAEALERAAKPSLLADGEEVARAVRAAVGEQLAQRQAEVVANLERLRNGAVEDSSPRSIVPVAAVPPPPATVSGSWTTAALAGGVVLIALSIATVGIAIRAASEAPPASRAPRVEEPHPIMPEITRLDRLIAAPPASSPAPVAAAPRPPRIAAPVATVASASASSPAPAAPSHKEPKPNPYVR
jgi:serine/threonine-protein kinase